LGSTVSSGILASEPTEGKKNLFVFCLLWLVTFILYLPTAKAGWVIDSAGWLYNITHMGFWDYINRTQSGIPSLYQFTQFTTYLFYKLWGANPWCWHVLMVTMHAVNAWLVFIICSRLFTDSGIKNAGAIALGGVILYTISPHLSEVIVWEASYHYLQGFLFILLILFCVQQFLYMPRYKYIWWAGIIYFLSTYSLEIFYLTPWFTLTLAAYYRTALHYDKKVFKKTIQWFFIPQLILFFLHLVALRLVYAHFAHIAENLVQPAVNYLCKAPKYLFHVLFFGRYFSYDIRQKVYHLCESTKGLIVFYSVFIVLCIYIAARFKKMASKGKAGTLLFVWLLLSLFILTPLAFPDILLMFYDRYTYFLNAFVYMLLALFVSYIPNKYIRILLLSVYGLTNLYFTIKVNRYWQQSTNIDNSLLQNLPPAGDKIILLLNIPENMNGIAMIGAQPEGEYKAMRDQFVEKKVNNVIYDVASYNMLTAKDGAHIMVVNDSMLHVTLNQWGTWWWYEGHGGRSYETKDYKLNMIDSGHWYELTLKHPSSQYMLLYSVGDQWKIVDMNRKNEDQN